MTVVDPRQRFAGNSFKRDYDKEIAATPPEEEDQRAHILLEKEEEAKACYA